MVTTLYRMAGEPETEGDSPFTDVDMERFYGKAVVWAAKNGIAKGVSTTVFAPHAPVTREQMVTFLYRYANLAGEDVTGDYDLTEFGDPWSHSQLCQGTAGLGRGQGTRHRHGRSPESQRQRNPGADRDYLPAL